MRSALRWNMKTTQTDQMSRLIEVFNGCTCNYIVFVMWCHVVAKYYFLLYKVLVIL